MDSFLHPIEDIIEDAKNGKMFILVDDSDRENEGDLIVSASHLTEEHMVQMINYTSGIVCLVIDENRRKMLNINLQNRSGEKIDDLYTAFLTSIEASEGITTGVSAQDRVTTIKAAISDENPSKKIMTPGHIFPLLAHKDGLKARQGHTEASITIMELAGLKPCAVISEIMNKDGTMSRLPELVNIAKDLNIKISSINLLIKYINDLESEKIKIHEVINETV